MAEQLYAQVAQAKYYELENCYFMHYLDSQHFIYLEKQLMFKMFLRLRHDLLNDPAMRQVIGEYVDPAELEQLLLRYQVYKAIVRRLQPPGGQRSGVRRVRREVRGRPGSTATRTARRRRCCTTWDCWGSSWTPTPGQDAANALMASLEKLLGSCRGSLTYQYSRIHSMMGNILFKYSLMDECLAAKLKAQELLSEDAVKNGVPEPKFAPPCTREQHQFQIWSVPIAELPGAR